MKVKTGHFLNALCLMTSLNSYAQEVRIPFLDIAPKVCITQQKKNICELNIHIRFKIDPYNKLCLEVTDHPQYHRCYNQLGVIEEQLFLQTSQPIRVQLINPLNNQVVNQQQLEIAKYKAKDYRIKRRFGWSL